MVSVIKHLLCIISIASIISSCDRNANPSVTDDSELKKQLAGVWVNSDDNEVTFSIEGDSIYYPDRSIEPVFFQVTKDTLYLLGKEKIKYPLLKCTEHVLHFINVHGEKVMLERVSEALTSALGLQPETMELDINQQLIKSDTVVTANDKRYHCYMQVNPTRYKVAKTEINNEGVEIERFYFDNMLYAAVYEGANKLFSRDFVKNDFASFVPQEVLERSILNNIYYKRCSAEEVVFEAEITMPGSASQYVVDIVVNRDGSMKLETK